MRSLLVCMMIVFAIPVFGGAVKSPFNNRIIETDSLNSYSFVVGGHFYGNGAVVSGYPASTLLGGLGRILEFDPDALFITGDLFLNVEEDSANYGRSLFSQMPFPIFNAVGNHDLDGDMYAPYGPTYQHFFISDDLFIILDTEMDDGSIKGDQLQFLRSSLAEAERQETARVFVFSHRPIWAMGDEGLDELLKGNTRSILGNNFGADVEPLLQQMMVRSKIYWFSGSMGGQAPASFLYHEKEGGTYILTAIRDTRRDAVLGVTVEGSRIHFNTIALGAQKVHDLEFYNIDYWRSHRGNNTNGFNYRLIAYYIKTTIIHQAFWSGLGLALVVLLGWKLLWRAGK